MIKISILMLTMASVSSYAGGIGAPLNISSASVLPKGVRNLTYKGVTASPSDKFNSSGQQVVLADPFFSEITFANLLDGTKDPNDKGLIEAKMIEMGASLEDSLGSVKGQVNIEVQANVPVFAWGITERFTAAVAIPVTRSSVNIDTGVDHKNPALHAALKQKTNIAPDKQVETFTKLNDPVNEKVKEYNYEPLQNETTTKLGDIKLVGKYKTYEDAKNVVTLGAEVTLPTGEEENPNKVIDVPGGDGQTDIGLNIAHDLILGKFVLASSLGYTVQFSDTVEKRIPFNGLSKLSPDSDNNVKRDLGDIFQASLGAKYGFSGVTLGTAYSLQYKQADTYKGSKYEQSRYDYLAQDSVQNMQAALFSVGYDTIGLYRAKKFPVPLSLNLTHTRVLSGKNVVKDPFTTLDFSLFF